MKLIFLSYINRSGSSFLAQQLSKYDDVFVFPEGDVLIDKFLLNDKIKPTTNTLIKLFDKDKKLRNWNITKSDVINITKKYKLKKDIFINLLTILKNKYKPTAEILIFKKRDAFIKYDKVKDILDLQIEIISIIRDPRAIFYSQKKSINPFLKKPFNINPLITAYYWNFYIEETFKLPNNIIVKYEDLINNTHRIIDNILFKISSKKNMSEGSIKYIDLISEQEQKLHSDINLTPQKEFINKWEKNLKKYQISIINNICKENIIKHNYRINSSNSAKYYFWYLYFKIRIFFKIDTY